MKKMVQLLALCVSVMMPASSLFVPAFAAEDKTTEDSGSFLYCDTLLPFDSGETEYTVVNAGDTLFDIFTVTQNGTTEKPTPWQVAYNSDKDALAISTNGQDGYQTRLKLAFGVDLTEDSVIDYKVTAGYKQYYLICDASGNNGADGANKMGESAVHTIDKTARYTLVTDSETKTISYYIDGVWKYSEVYEGDSVTLYHSFQSDQRGTNTVRHNYLYYFAAYKPAAVPAFQVVAANTTSVTVQFNTPVDPETLTNITVGEQAVTAYEDVSASYNEPNVYKLTVAELTDDAQYAVKANGVTGLSPDGTAAGTALSMADKTATLGTPVLGFAKRINDYDGDTLWGDVLDYSNATNCALTYDSATNSFAVTQGETMSGSKLARASARLFTPFFAENPGRFVVEFQAEPARANNTITFKWGQNWLTAGSNVTTALLPSAQTVGNLGTLVHYVLDFDFTDPANGSATVYKDGVVQNTVTGLSGTGKKRLWIYPATICGADETVPATFSLRNFSIYQPTVSAFTGEVYDTADGKAMRFSQGLNMKSSANVAASAATIVNKADASKTYTAGVVRMQDTASDINGYQVNTAKLPAGEYTVTVNPVAFDGSTLAALTYDISITDEALVLSGLSMQKGETVTASVNAANNRNGNISFTMILCEYETAGDGLKLINVYSASKAATPGQSTITHTITPTKDGSVFKAFAWANTNTMKPLVNAAE